MASDATHIKYNASKSNSKYTTCACWTSISKIPGAQRVLGFVLFFIICLLASLHQSDSKFTIDKHIRQLAVWSIAFSELVVDMNKIVCVGFILLVVLGYLCPTDAKKSSSAFAAVPRSKSSSKGFQRLFSNSFMNKVLREVKSSFSSQLEALALQVSYLCVF
jgi:hypothetical protein